MDKKLPFNKEEILKIIKIYPTPFYIYDELDIRNRAKSLNKAFSWCSNYKNFYAVKALPNPAIIRILAEEGMGADCSSLAELIISEKAGIKGSDIMFTSNQTPAHEYKAAMQLNAIINLDDITHINYLEQCCKLPELLSFRYNPGSLKTGNDIIGNPVDAKYGLTREQIIEAYKISKQKGVKEFGIHTMVASNELNADYFIETASIIFELSKFIKDVLDIEMTFINLGGGLGIPYKPNQNELDVNAVGEGIKTLYDKYFSDYKKKPAIYTESGRYVTGPSGYLITTAIHEKNIYKNYIGMDACSANLMRPAIYGAYHHITVLGKEGFTNDALYDIVGSLCENSDKFAVDRKLPKINIGDILVIHDVGAHGHSMGYNYNGKLRSAELLLKPDKSIELIRRAETLDDYFSTLTVN